MKRTRHTTEQITEKLRQADVALGKGQKVPGVCKRLAITSHPESAERLTDGTPQQPVSMLRSPRTYCRPFHLLLLIRVAV